MQKLFDLLNNALQERFSNLLRGNSPGDHDCADQLGNGGPGLGIVFDKMADVFFELEHAVFENTLSGRTGTRYFSGQ